MNALSPLENTAHYVNVAQGPLHENNGGYFSLLIPLRSEFGPILTPDDD